MAIAGHPINFNLSCVQWALAKCNTQQYDIRATKHTQTNSADAATTTEVRTPL
jgi:hypothetical protein